MTAERNKLFVWDTNPLETPENLPYVRDEGLRPGENDTGRPEIASRVWSYHKRTA